MIKRMQGAIIRKAQLPTAAKNHSHPAGWQRFLAKRCFREEHYNSPFGSPITTGIGAAKAVKNPKYFSLTFDFS